MKTDVINVKIDPQTKKQARRYADEMGFSLGTLITAYLKHFVKTKIVYFNYNNEEPSEWLINELEQAKKDREEGWVSPGFTTTKDMMAWIKNPKRRYANGKTDNGN